MRLISNFLEYSRDDMKTITKVMIHCADLSGPTKDFPIALKWAKKVNEEFSKQVILTELLIVNTVIRYKRKSF